MDEATCTDATIQDAVFGDVNDVYDTLSHPRRLYLCYTLQAEREWTLTELATKIAAWENDVSEQAVRNRQRRRVHFSLYHVHVPKLVEQGIVDFDEETETISIADEQVVDVLDELGSAFERSKLSHARQDIDD